VNGLDALDAKMREVDGTELKTNVGGNGMTAASFALAAAGAEVQGVELYEYLSETFHGSKEAMPTKYSLPRPMVKYAVRVRPVFLLRRVIASRVTSRCLLFVDVSAKAMSSKYSLLRPIL
jgi:hypothetical protein